jgi:glycine oxidase
VADISCDILVVGAGVLGLCVAVELSARGRDVRVIDPGGANASSVAAGMIAPAFESLLDGADADRAALLRTAAALWPGMAHRLGVALDIAPAEWCGPDSAGVASRLQALGFAVDWIGDRVATRADVRLDPREALVAMHRALAGRTILGEARELQPAPDGWRIQTTTGSVAARNVVLATGTARSIAGLPPGPAALVDDIEPVAGQIGRSAEVRPVAVLRAPDGYVGPSRNGLMIGATMVVGCRDASPDPEASRRLEGMAERLLGRPLARSVVWSGGVRGATVDGLPMAGPTDCPGLHLALGPRRNGWLLGPLVGEILADGIEGRSRRVGAVLLDPMRFAADAVN